MSENQGGESSYGSQYGQPQYGQPQYGQPPSFGSTPDTAQPSQPQYGQPQYGQPQYSQPQYGQPQYGQPQQPYGQPAYGQGGYDPYGGGMAKTGTNGLAIASLVLGIIPFAGVGAIVAIVLGIVARKQIKVSGQGGKGMALAGIILGTLWIVFFIGIIVLVVTVGHSSSCVYYGTGTDTCGTTTY